MYEKVEMASDKMQDLRDAEPLLKSKDGLKKGFLSTLEKE